MVAGLPESSQDPATMQTTRELKNPSWRSDATSAGGKTPVSQPNPVLLPSGHPHSAVERRYRRRKRDRDLQEELLVRQQHLLSSQKAAQANNRRAPLARQQNP